jgi:heptaprenyl diphosphate synthase
VSVPLNVVEELRLPGLEEALVRVEAALSEATAAEDPFLSEVAAHLASAGGKRLRPALLIASSQACAGAAGADGSDAASVAHGVVTHEAVMGGVAVELVHLGSLYHDDVMDEAANRRGVQSVNARWGNLVAILAGDFLLARASEIAASLGTEVAALLARTISRLCEGEVGQLRYAFDVSRPLDSYRASISGKTASLMATSARIGALVAGAPRPWVDALTSYGESLGMAFQIWDDVRDVVCSDEALGKPAGHDMVEGTYTLPVLLALRVDGVGEDLRSLLGAPIDAPAREKARDLVLSSGAVPVAVAEARRWASAADSALDPLRAGADAPWRLDRLSMLGGVGHWLLDQLELP